MNLLTDYCWPDLTDDDISYPDFVPDPILIREAEARGFSPGQNLPEQGKYLGWFDTLFFFGGSLEFKDSVNPDFAQRMYKVLLAVMHTYRMSHESKAALCAMILSEIASDIQRPPKTR